MGFKIDIKGLDEMKRKFDRLKKNLKAVDGVHSVPIEELLTPAFLRAHSEFDSFEALLRDGAFVKPGDQLPAERFRAIPDKAWVEWIAKATDFPDGKQMEEPAGAEYLKRKLAEGLYGRP